MVGGGGGKSREGFFVYGLDAHAADTKVPCLMFKDALGGLANTWPTQGIAESYGMLSLFRSDSPTASTLMQHYYRDIVLNGSQ